MKCAIDKSIKDGADDLVICGMQVIGFLGRAYVMDLRFEGIYCMILIGEFELSMGSTSWASYPNSAISLIQVLKRLKEEGVKEYGAVMAPLSKIGKDQLVGHLKEAIKAKKQNDFAGIDADRLRNIFMSVSPPGATTTSSREQELLEVVASLRALIKKSNFDVVVSQNGLRTVNIEDATLEGLKEYIQKMEKPPALENDSMVLKLISDGKDIHLGTLERSRSLQSAPYQRRISSLLIGTPSKPFTEWNFPKGRIVGLVEVKRDDFKQGFAVQMESSLTYRKRKANEIDDEYGMNKVWGIVTDAEKWYFMECTLDEERKPSFKLSEPVIVEYNDENTNQGGKGSRSYYLVVG
ncbi:hypothetical protein C1646_811016 [Rhizophagus diaphanus]|nr:hypothetical protein C1646_811016 [Rhizophagus diaphanus] [Rhizophagus sp. MUCL 43196]